MIRFRLATKEDLPAIVGLIADDGLGSGRDDASLPLDAAYVSAFDAMGADGNQAMLVGELDGEVVAYLQVTFIPGLSRKGAWRGQIESVRVASRLRGKGIGGRLLEEAIGLCRARGCHLVQLTSDKTRAEAHRFYGRLGFVASHDGFKLAL
ncbi:MAG: GNAT family N-acetyltransferase [Anderseniella sp.]|nr:GNAT family N-acetyltransferase [Anderseniella sp.]